jgi:hypothetical protein
MADPDGDEQLPITYSIVFSTQSHFLHQLITSTTKQQHLSYFLILIGGFWMASVNPSFSG